MALPVGPLHGHEYLSAALVRGTGHSQPIFRAASPTMFEVAKSGQKIGDRHCLIPINQNSNGDYIANLGLDNIGFP